MSRNLQVTNLAILVDGQNFISNIRKLFHEEFDPEDYLPRNADWNSLFRSSAKMLGAKNVSIYWYTIKELDFSPFVDWTRENLENFSEEEYERWKKILIRRDAEQIQKEGRRLSKAEEAFLRQSTHKGQKKVINRWRRICHDNEVEMRARLAEWHHLQELMAEQCSNAITIRRTGWQLCQLVDKHLHTEKGVDISLATDLAFLAPYYDAALLFTSDGDYVPMIRQMQCLGKTIGHVEFGYRTGGVLRGTARRLIEHSDFALEIPYVDLKNFLRIPSEPYQRKQKSGSITYPGTKEKNANWNKLIPIFPHRITERNVVFLFQNSLLV